MREKGSLPGWGTPVDSPRIPQATLGQWSTGEGAADQAVLFHDVGEGEGEPGPVLKARVFPSTFAGRAQAGLPKAGKILLRGKEVVRSRISASRTKLKMGVGFCDSKNSIQC